MKNSTYKKYGLFLYYIIYIISKTLKIDIIKNSKVDNSKSCICGFWHNKLIGVSLGLIHLFNKKVALASPSKDGELISIPLEKLGFSLVRGSTGDNPIRALLTLVKMVKSGYTAGTPLDGPKGPIYEVKPGMLYLAQKSGKPLVPIGISFNRYWIFNGTWDKLIFPKPFARMVCVIGDPIYIPKDANLDDYLQLVKTKLFEADTKALEKIDIKKEI